jgi:hypothetical protein
MRAQLLDHGSVATCRTTFNIQIEAIDNSVAEWTSVAVTTTENIPKRIGKAGCL